MLSAKQIEQFRQIYKTESGREISYEEALELATKLITFFELILELKNKKINF